MLLLVSSLQNLAVYTRNEIVRTAAFTVGVTQLVVYMPVRTIKGDTDPIRREVAVVQGRVLTSSGQCLTLRNSQVVLLFIIKCPITASLRRFAPSYPRELL
jgi:hypothetical protein